ncbi:MAG: hypothetical protein V3V09_09075 [Arenicellales bacterium]
MKRLRQFAIVSACLFVTTACNAGQKCTYDDGYICAPRDEQSLKFNQQEMVPAVYLTAWQVAYEGFLRHESLSAKQKDLQHYKIGFAESADHYIVIFRALLLAEKDENGNVIGLSRGSVGKSIRYEVDKANMQVQRWQFYK